MQSLIGVAYGLSQLRDGLGAERVTGAEATERLDRLVGELAAAEQGMRRLITSLESAGKAELESLAVIVETEVERFRRICSARTELAVPLSVFPDTHSQEIAVRSVLREALNNVAKHAHAEEALVLVSADEDDFRLEVVDDGCGFDPAAVNGDRIGLASMQERLQLLGGRLEIESKPGGPTRVLATFRRWHPDTGA
jgi:signal transduction histidine kinase